MDFSLFFPYLISFLFVFCIDLLAQMSEKQNTGIGVVRERDGLYIDIWMIHVLIAFCISVLQPGRILQN